MFLCSMGAASAMHYVACVVFVTTLLCGAAHGSYLDATRFHFNGTFYCDVSTLNNFIVNYDPGMYGIHSHVYACISGALAWISPGRWRCSAQ